MKLRPTPLMLAMLVASLSFAQAQELRAAPPREPDVLRAAPDTGTVAQERRDIAGRWLGATDSAVQEFGKVGGTLTNASLSQFEGVSGAIAKADWASSYGALSAGDIRGAVSGAVAIKVGAAATSGGAALFGEAGAVAGGAIGSFFPVVGNVAGTMVGGAIGTAAGGFITAYGYDKYVKDYVSKGVVAGIASVFDTAPLDQAMQARRAFLLQTMAPEQQAQLQVFKPEEVSLLDFGTLPYVPIPKQPVGTQQQAALPPVGAPTGDFLIDIGDAGALNCTVAAGTVRCEGSYALGMARWKYMFDGTLNGSTATGTHSTILDQRYQSGCGYRELMQWPSRLDFEDGGRVRVTQSQGTIKLVSNSCPVPPRSVMPPGGSSGVTTWRPRQ